MNDQQRAAMQMALEALEFAYINSRLDIRDKVDPAITALREALVQPQGEPIGWMWRVHGWIVSINGKHRGIKTYIDLCRPPNSVIESDEFIELLPVYTTPPSTNALVEAAIESTKEKAARIVVGWTSCGPITETDRVLEKIIAAIRGMK